MRLRLGVPAYGYPGTGVWESFALLPRGSLIIMDPADGPGRAADPRYAAVAAEAMRQGLHVLGYVTADYGRRSGSELEEEVARYRQWYAPDGIFLDQCPASVSAHAEIVRGFDYVRRLAMSLVINPGQPEVDPEDAAVADHVINFEGPYSVYRRTYFPDWVRDFPPEKFWHLIYDVVDADAMRAVSDAAARAHAGIVYITDATMPNPWDRVPSYWREEQDLMAEAVGSR